MGRSTIVIAGLTLLLAACGDSPTGVAESIDLSAEWRTDSPSAQGLAQQGYGYLRWIDHAGNRTHFFAWGFGGQFVWVAPELEMVVVVTTDWRAATVPAGQLATNGLRLIVDHVLPAAR